MLRLNEIFTQHFLYITALTYTRFGINRSCITSPNLKATTPLLGSQNKCRHAVQYTLHPYWYSHMFIPYFFCIICNRSLYYIQKVMKNFVQVHQNKHIHTQNAMPQASIRPETDPSKEKKSAVQCTVGGCVVSLGGCPNIPMSCES